MLILIDVSSDTTCVEIIIEIMSFPRIPFSLSFYVRTVLNREPNFCNLHQVYSETYIIGQIDGWCCNQSGWMVQVVD